MILLYITLAPQSLQIIASIHLALVSMNPFMIIIYVIYASVLLLTKLGLQFIDSSV